MSVANEITLGYLPPPTGYQPRYGALPGLRERIAEWSHRLGTDRSLPWAGLGLIADLEAVLKILNLREFAEHLRVTGTDEQREFADEILRDQETLEATESALRYAGFTNFDPVAAIETMARDTRNDQLAQIRAFLVEQGMLAPDDHETPIVPLVRAFLS